MEIHCLHLRSLLLSTMMGIESGLLMPHYPQSNGRAEAAVKSMKKSLHKCWNHQKGALDMDKWPSALLQYRNTPDASGLSPAQHLLGHPIQNALPVHHSAFSKEWQKQVNEAETKAAELKQKSVENYNAKAKPLPKLVVGNHVIVQDQKTKEWTLHGKVVETAPH